jgi:hypothetical protein
MRRSILVALLTIAGFLAVWSFTTSAQVIDATACQSSCTEQKSFCVTECGRHDNPVECEAGCHDALDECLQDCG